MNAAVTMEYLETPHSARRRPTLLVTAVVLVLVLAGIAFVWWNDTVRTSANERLVQAVGEATDRVRSGDLQVQGTLAYTSPMIWSAAVPAEVREGLRIVVQDSAAEVAADLASMRTSVAAVRVLPWQRAQLDARTAVLELLAAQEERFDRIAADATAIGTVLAEDPPSAVIATAALRASGATELPLR